MQSKHYIGMNLSIVFRHTQLILARELEPLGLGQGQYAYLLSVCKKPGIIQESLTEDLLYNKSSVARAIGQLEQKGFLLRMNDPQDKRSYRLFPTQKGRDMYQIIVEKLEKINEQLTMGFSDEEKALTEGFLRRMTDNVHPILPKETENRE